MAKITLKQIRNAVKMLEAKKVLPAVVESKRQAARMTKADKIIGLNHKWRVGDEYYEACIHPANLK